jgi:hypothetical protein
MYSVWYKNANYGNYIKIKVKIMKINKTIKTIALVGALLVPAQQATAGFWDYVPSFCKTDTFVGTGMLSGACLYAYLVYVALSSLPMDKEFIKKQNDIALEANKLMAKHANAPSSIDNKNLEDHTVILKLRYEKLTDNYYEKLTDNYSFNYNNTL